jgi:pimeloyl-ACP methyl ester carboxylesterase
MATQRHKLKLGQWIGLTTAGYLLGQQGWLWGQIARRDPRRTLATQRNEAPPGVTFSDTCETEVYTRTHTVEDGIERIVYVPQHRRFETPIIMQHGMWHGAWCWEWWQALFAEWGWETRAHSLPSHGRSPVQRSIKTCTLDYYLSFLKMEMDRSPVRPVLMGHSMGGALTQWYFKYVADDLPAAVLVAPWVSHSMLKDGLIPLLRFAPLVTLMMALEWDATSMVLGGPQSALGFLAGPNAVMSLAEIEAKLGPESGLVLFQHNPPFWTPPDHVRTPLLWLAGEDDPLLVESVERRSATYYGADYSVAPGARHNLMLEHNARETAAQIREWLEGRGIK